MCLAIGPICNHEKSALGRLWWRIASQPHKLFLFSAVVHSCIYLILLLTHQISFASHTLVSGVFIAHGLIGFSLLGFLIYQFPLWFKTSEISYASYGISYNLAFIGLLLMDTGMVFSDVWSIVGSSMLVISWLIAIKALHWSYFWSLGARHGLIKLVMWMLYFNFIMMLAGLVVAFVGVQFISDNMMALFEVVSVILLAITSLLLFARQELITQ